MTDSRSDYARTDELDDVLIPLEQVRERVGISHVTLWRRMKAANVEAVKHNAGKALRFADVVAILKVHH